MERLAGIGVALAVLGGLAIYQGAKQLSLAAGSSRTPQDITLADLIARGPGDNRYVRVRDFCAESHYVAVGKKNDVIKDAYVPLRPAGEETAGGPRVAILKTTSMSAQWFAPKGPLEGMVTSASLNGLAREKLREKYPGTDFKDVVVIEGGERPPAPREGWGYVGLGVVLLLPLVGMFAFALLKDRRDRKAAEPLARAWQAAQVGRADLLAGENAPDVGALFREAINREQRGDWQQAGACLEQVINKSNNPELVAVAREHLRRLREKGERG
jgi:hypothetical protein